MRIYSITVEQLNKIGYDFGTELIKNMELLPGKEYSILNDNNVPILMQSPNISDDIKRILNVFIQFLNYNQYNCSLIVK